MTRISDKSIAEVTADPSKQYHTVELAWLLDETMDLDIKSKMPAARWTELAKAELRNNTENLRYIFCRRATPAGYLDEAFLTPNAVAAYTGIGPDDSDYRAASDMAKGQMHRTNMRRGLQRRFLRGESY